MTRLLVLALVLSGCAHAHRVRARNAIMERCVEEIDSARTDEEAAAIRSRCDDELEIVEHR